MAWNTQKIAGSVISVLVAVFLVFSGSGKVFFNLPPKERIDTVGYKVDTWRKVGVVEMLTGIVYIVPQTTFIGAILVTAQLGGAMATHVRIGEPPFGPFLIGILAWIGYALRRPDVICAALKRRRKPATLGPPSTV